MFETLLESLFEVEIPEDGLAERVLEVETLGGEYRHLQGGIEELGAELWAYEHSTLAGAETQLTTEEINAHLATLRGLRLETIIAFSEVSNNYGIIVDSANIEEVMNDLSTYADSGVKERLETTLESIRNRAIAVELDMYVNSGLKI